MSRMVWEELTRRLKSFFPFRRELHASKLSLLIFRLDYQLDQRLTFTSGHFAAQDFGNRWSNVNGLNGTL